MRVQKKRIVIFALNSHSHSHLLVKGNRRGTTREGIGPEKAEKKNQRPGSGDGRAAPPGGLSERPTHLCADHRRSAAPHPRVRLDAESRAKGAKPGAGKVEAAKKVGRLIAEKALAQSIQKVVFDRNGFLYHGRIKALADGAREKGLDF